MATEKSKSRRRELSAVFSSVLALLVFLLMPGYSAASDMGQKLRSDLQAESLAFGHPRFSTVRNQTIATSINSRVQNPESETTHLLERPDEKASAAAVSVCGAITSNTIWTAAESPYLLTCNVTVNAGVTLTLEAGVVVKLGASSSLFVSGGLVSQGTEASPNHITSLKDDTVGGDSNNDGTATAPAAGDWPTIYVANTGHAALDFTTIRYGGNTASSYDANLYLYNTAQATLNHVTIGSSQRYGIYIYQTTTGVTAHLALDRSTLENNASHGFYAPIAAANVIAITNSVIRNNAQYGVYVGKANGIDLSNNSFTGNGVAAALSFSSGSFTSLAGNSGSGNGRNGILLNGAFGQSVTLPSNPGFPYIVPTSNLSINSGVTVTLPAGTVVKMEGSLFVNGGLVSQGTEASPNYITSLKDDSVGGDSNNDSTATAPAAGDWSTLYVANTGQVVMDYTTIRYGGNTASSYDANLYLYNTAQATLNHVTIGSSQRYGIYIYQTTTAVTARLALDRSTLESNVSHGFYAPIAAANVIAITNSVIRNNAQYGVYVGRANGVDLSNNTFTGNGIPAALSFANGSFTSLVGNSGSGNGKNGILLNGSFGQSVTLPSNPGFPYIVPASNLSINSGVTLTLPAGTVIKMEGSLNVNGGLVSQGTEASPNFITSLKDDSVGGDSNNDSTTSAPAAGDWPTIYVANTGQVVLDFTTIRYGGNTASSYDANLYLYNTAQATLNHVTIGSSQRYGIYIYQTTTGVTAHLALDRSTLENNASHGFYAPIAAANVIAITNSVIRNNAQYGVYVGKANGIDLSNNSFTGNGVAAALSFSSGSFTSLVGNSGSGNGRNGILLNGSFGQSVTLPSNPGFPYIVPASNLSINSGVTLTLPAGTVIKMEGSLNVNGGLVSQGTEASPNFITSLKDDSVGGDSNNDSTATAPAAGDWSTLYVANTGQVVMDYTTIRYGGNTASSYDANLYLYNTAQATLNHVTIGSSQRYGIYIYQTTTAVTARLALDRSTLESNVSHGFYAPIAAANVIAITNSVIRNNAQYGVYVGRANGVNLSNNTFTGNGIPAALSFANGSFTSLVGNSGSGNGKNGILLNGSFGQSVTLPSNPGFPYIVPASNLSINSGVTLTLPAGTVIKMEGSLFVNGGLVSQGTEASPNFITSLKDDSVGGDSNNDSTATAPAAGDWSTLYVANTGQVVMDYTTIRYGGNTASSYDANLYLYNTAQATLNHVTIGSSQRYGIYIYQTTTAVTARLALDRSTLENNASHGLYAPTAAANVIAITNSIIRNNAQYGVYVSNGSRLTIDGSSIVSNTQWGISLANSSNARITNCAIFGNTAGGLNNLSPSQPVTAAMNWWGDPSGPANATSNASGLGNSVSDGIIFQPWQLTSPGSAPQIPVLELATTSTCATYTPRASHLFRTPAIGAECGCQTYSSRRSTDTIRPSRDDTSRGRAWARSHVIC